MYYSLCARAGVQANGRAGEFVKFEILLVSRGRLGYARPAGHNPLIKNFGFEPKGMHDTLTPPRPSSHPPRSSLVALIREITHGVVGRCPLSRKNSLFPPPPPNPNPSPPILQSTPQPRVMEKNRTQKKRQESHSSRSHFSFFSITISRGRV